LVLRLFGQGQALVMKEKALALVGEPTNPLKGLKNPIKAKLETSKDKLAVMVITNQTKSPLNHCLVFTRAFNDKAKVEKYIEGELTKAGFAAAILKPSEDSIKAGAWGLILKHQLLSLERGGVVYLPTLPAGATLRMPLMTALDAELLKSSAVSLYCDELTAASLDAGTLPIVLVGGPGTPIKLDKNGAATIKFSLSPKDPTDPEAIGVKMVKAFSVPMTAGKTYTIRVTTQQFGTDLRVEDATGKTQVKSKERATFMSRTIGLEFTPAADGQYRIVCSEAYSGPQPFTLTVQRK
jgi:hypothetical protein